MREVKEKKSDRKKEIHESGVFENRSDIFTQPKKKKVKSMIKFKKKKKI